jgi:hypothetical protein
VVVATPTGDLGTRFWVETTATGFTIKTSAPASAPVEVAWIAIE